MNLLDEKSIEWAFKHIYTYYDSDFFPKAFEYEAIKHDWINIKNKIMSIDINEYTPKSPRILLAPKSNDNYRIVHQLEPIDTIIYTALVYEISEHVEKYRIPVEKEAVFSYRITPSVNGSWFESGNNWKKFLNKAKGYAEKEEINYIIKCDITDFYNQIYTHRVNNLIAEAGTGELDEHAVVIEKFLMGLNKKTSRGIPIGPSASIVLSELILGDIDRKILMYTNNFVRYVDDFYIFTSTKEEALKILHDLTQYLYSSHRLVFSSSKTRIIEKNFYLDNVYKDEEYEEELIRKSTVEDMANEIYDDILEEIKNISPYELEILTPEMSEIYKSVEKKDKIKILSSVYTKMMENLLSEENYDFSMIRHVIKKANKYRIRAIANIILDKIEELMPVIREIIIYLITISNDRFIEENIEKIENMWNTPYTDLTYVNNWLTYYWYSKNIFRFSDKIKYRNIIDLRKQALAARVKLDTNWVRTHKDDADLLGLWNKRAVLYSSSILPHDEMRSWLNAISSCGDDIDKAIYHYLISISV